MAILCAGPAPHSDVTDETMADTTDTTNKAAARTWTVGTTELVSLNDGMLQLPPNRFVDVSSRKDATTADVGGETAAIPVNCFLVRTRDELILIDAGCGGAFGDRAGHLVASLKLAGHTPDDIGAVLMTHLHVDHAAGLVDTQGHAVFPRAQLYVAEAEATHWRAVAAATANPDLSTKAAIAALTVYAGRLHFITPGARIPPGIESVPLPGHTPGHTGFMIADGGDKVLVWGDIIHSAALQFSRPDFGYAADVDGALGVATRRGMFARAADTGLTVAGMHLPFPAVGMVQRRGDAFTFAPRAAR
jgi:glyoxylase-like metal-dependent hydrolase (beta-lactamase superfamily II)